MEDAMIVRVTAHQWNRLRDVSSPAVLAAIIERGERSGGTADYEAPYIAWELAKEAMAAEYLSPRKGRTERTGWAAMNCMRVIAAAQNVILRHPAFREMGAVGRQGGWFPAWTFPDPVPMPGGVRFYSPQPVVGGRFVVLGPVWEPDGRWTTWSEEGTHPRRDRLALEATHLACLE